MLNSDGISAPLMFISIPQMTRMFSFDVLADNFRYITCTYHGKPRVGLDLGDDTRPGTSNRVIITLDGIRTLKKDKMIALEDITTLVI